jgi:hypothetical protein
MNKLMVVLTMTAAICSTGLSGQDRWSAQERAKLVFCDDEILKGHYALSISGTRPAPVVLPAFPGVAAGTMEQVTGVFILIFDGNGSIRMGENPTVKGSLSGLFPDKAGTGTYAVNSDCSGTFSVSLPQLPAPLVNNMVIMNGGKEFRSVVISPQPVMISVTAAQVK